MKTVIPVNDGTVTTLASAAFNPHSLSNRTILKDYLDKVFFIRAEATKEIKTIDGKRMRLFTDVSARLLTTTGVLEQIVKSKTLHFHHVWLDDQDSRPGEIYTMRYIAFEYRRLNETSGYGFRGVDYGNPAELYEVNFRTAIALLDLQLFLSNSHDFRLCEESLLLALRTSIDALQESESSLTSMYQTLRYSECRPTRGVLGLLNLWLETLERHTAHVSPKKPKKVNSKGFARA